MQRDLLNLCIDEVLTQHHLPLIRGLFKQVEEVFEPRLEIYDNAYEMTHVVFQIICLYNACAQELCLNTSISLPRNMLLESDKSSILKSTNTESVIVLWKLDHDPFFYQQYGNEITKSIELQTECSFEDPAFIIMSFF